MALLTRDAILNVSDIKTETVSVPEWNGDVCVRELNGADRDVYLASITPGPGETVADKCKTAAAKLLQLSCIDPETGNLMFSAGDIDTLSRKSGAAVQRVCSVASRLSRLNPSDLRELSKNSKATQSDTSATN
jgi:hypothetical protein